ncbi:hypothetical protein SAMN05519104_7687 [Rhizobiales bacterium GAS188]|nr:hypothetical protein SAMN05519104_7687 [Rhizobiales bacterium GAS188]
MVGGPFVLSLSYREIQFVKYGAGREVNSS